MSATAAIAQTLRDYVASTTDALAHGQILHALSPIRAFQAWVFLVSYILFQRVFIIPFFKPRPPKKSQNLEKPHGRIAVIGAGLTGISSAAHCISHNFEVVIFESKDKVGGIWADVNSTSALQLNSLIYRFHPGVLWRHTYPNRNEILSEIGRIWKEYHLESRTRFRTPVRSVRRADGTKSPGAKWLINDGNDGAFDAVIVTIGTCGKPQMVDFPGMPRTHWADDHDKEEAETEKARKKYNKQDGEGGENGNRGSYQQGHYSIGLSYQNAPRRDDNEEKRREKERKERERREQEQREQDRRRRAGRHEEFNDEAQLSPLDSNAPTFAEVAAHAPADDSVALNSKLEGDGADKPLSPLDPKAPSFATIAARPPADDSAALNMEPEGGRDDDEESETGLWEVAEEDDRETIKEGGSPHRDHRDDREWPSLHEKSKGKNKQDDGEVFQGKVLHSSELDKAKGLDGATVIIIGSGASGVEAAETALERGAKKAIVVARDDKWIIPRNTFIDTLISAQPFGREMPLSFLWEWFIRKFHYRDLQNLAPTKSGLYEGTPVVNNAFLDHIREKRIEYVRGDTERLTASGVRVKRRPRGTKPGDKPSTQVELKGDVVVLATGFKRPSLDFLPNDLFPEDFQRPDLYLQNFAVKDWTVLCTNSSYTNAIGTVGHFHIGIYTRILLLFLLDPHARPEQRDMELWVNLVRFIKRGASGGALGFFTYMELVIWFLTFHIFRPDRLAWIFFTMQGWGVPVKD